MEGYTCGKNKTEVNCCLKVRRTGIPVEVQTFARIQSIRGRCGANSIKCTVGTPTETQSLQYYYYGLYYHCTFGEFYLIFYSNLLHYILFYNKRIVIFNVTLCKLISLSFRLNPYGIIFIVIISNKTVQILEHAAVNNSHIEIISLFNNLCNSFSLSMFGYIFQV